MMNAKTNNFIFGVFIVAGLSFVYVHQQIESLKAGYSIQSNEKEQSYFLDQRGRLVYNLSKLKSPQELERILDKDAVKLVESHADYVYYASIKKDFKRDVVKCSTNEGIINKILDAFTERAEARTSMSKTSCR